MQIRRLPPHCVCLLLVGGGSDRVQEQEAQKAREARAGVAGEVRELGRAVDAMISVFG